MDRSGSAESPEVQLPDNEGHTITLNLIVRFSHSDLPDISLPLELPSPRSTASISPSVNNLKGKLRLQLPGDFAKHGLKLIYAGRVLHGLEPVEKALKLDPKILRGVSVSRNGSPRGSDNDDFHSSVRNDLDDIERDDAAAQGNLSATKNKERGKAPISNAASVNEEAKQPLLKHTGEGFRSERTAHTLPTIYLHCAITPMSLDPPALAAQRALESEPLPKESELGIKSSNLSRFRTQNLWKNEPSPVDLAEASTATENSGAEEQPRGFDRLLAPSSGFSEVDVQALRSQFRYVIESRYTPDTMPSPSTLLRMEESWLDESSYSVPSFSQPPISDGVAQADQGGNSILQPLFGGARATATTDPAGGGFTDDDAAAALDDTYIGVFIGFFWPLGACVWGLREEGIWSRRRGRAVMAGILINLLFGVVKVLS